MRVSELLEVWTEKAPAVDKSQIPGSGIIVAKEVPPAPVQPAKPVAKAAPVKPAAAPAEPAPFDPASHKNTLISIAKKMGITAINDLSNLLGQAQVETGSWTKAAESFNYTDPTRIYKVFTSNFPSPQHAAPYVGNQVALANRALANKNGNGDESSGDGWRFRGRGFLHITGRELYAKAGAALHPENPGIYLSNPTLLSSNPVEAAKAAVWYFNTKVGKGKTSKQATKVVNPAGLKSKERASAAAQMQAQLQTKKPRKA
jgi:predicted chitinase